MINRDLVFKLDPDEQTEQMFRQYAGVCRLVDNLALEQRATWGQRFKIDDVRQASDLTMLRAAFDVVRDVDVTCAQQALRDLDRAFVHVFKDLQQPVDQRHVGYPTPRKKGLNDSFRFQGREITVETLNATWARVRLPKIGWVNCRRTREIDGKIKNVTVSRCSLGWHISFSVEIEHEIIPAALPSVGIDRGVAVAVERQETGKE
jgi:putative transposase